MHAAEERDVTDLGLSPEVDRAELRRARALRDARQAQERGDVIPEQRRPASAETRRAAMELARETCGFRGPSRAAALRVPCPRCGAEPARWCRRGGRVLAGRVCAERATDGLTP